METLAVAIFINNERRIQNPFRYLAWSILWKQMWKPFTILAKYSTFTLHTPHKYLGRQGWGSWCFFWTSYSCCSRCTTELPWTCVQSDNIHCKATWLTELKDLVFLFLFSVGTWNILKVLRVVFYFCWNCYEWFLQFKPSTINIYINSKSFGRQQPCLKCNFSLGENWLWNHWNRIN